MSRGGSGKKTHPLEKYRTITALERDESSTSDFRCDSESTEMMSADVVDAVARKRTSATLATKDIVVMMTEQ